MLITINKQKRIKLFYKITRLSHMTSLPTHNLFMQRMTRPPPLFCPPIPSVAFQLMMHVAE